jgi:hypothetical protein
MAEYTPPKSELERKAPQPRIKDPFHTGPHGGVHKLHDPDNPNPVETPNRKYDGHLVHNWPKSDQAQAGERPANSSPAADGDGGQDGNY